MDLVGLWLHEAHRAYGDLLVSREEQQKFAEMANRVVSKHFEQELLVDKTLISGFNVWTYPADGGSYQRVESLNLLQDSLSAVLEQYNAGPNASMDLVLFMDAVLHITRIRRSLQTGH